MDKRPIAIAVAAPGNRWAKLDKQAKMIWLSKAALLIGSCAFIVGNLISL